MSDPSTQIRNKHQARTLVTQARILDAAQTIFSEQGFESAQLEEVAARAGCTRGAIYAHYSSKENLFLALVEQRVYSEFLAVYESIKLEPDRNKRLGIFKRWIIAQVCDPSWGTLMLEFKLYACRRPNSRKKLQRLQRLMFHAAAKDFVELLFGKLLTRASRLATERRIAVMGAVLSAVVLESHLRPKLLPRKELRRTVDELFDALVHTSDEAAPASRSTSVLNSCND